VKSKKANWAKILNPNSPATISFEPIGGEIRLAGNMVINVKSP
jgi:hypothetical protein